jgi:hypothetical protein
MKDARATSIDFLLPSLIHACMVTGVSAARYNSMKNYPFNANPKWVIVSQMSVETLEKMAAKLTMATLATRGSHR